MISRFEDDTFSESFQSTIGVDFKIKTLEVDGITINLQIWDTAGQERFKTLTSSYYRGAHGYIVVYDVTSQESFGSVHKWLQEIENYTHGHTHPVLLVGNKCDKESEREVTTKEGQELAETLDIRFIETSAKQSTNVIEAFTKMAATIKNNLYS
uniref:Uncharacterized protein n=1 Tax=Arcella intermedia TaxID=1963864 RepID=A0A6B2LM59_9EUKA